MLYKSGKIALIACLCYCLSACNAPLPPGDYDAAEVGKVKKVVAGTILSVRPVHLHTKGAELVNPSSTTVETGYADNSLNKSRGVEYVIKLNSGAIISVVQTENIKLKPKQSILVIYGENTRVVPDQGGSD